MVFFESNRWRADGVRVEHLPRIHYIEMRVFEKIQMMTELQCEPEQFNGRIIFMSMYNSVTVANYARRFLLGRLVIFGTWIREEMVRNLL